MRHLADEMGPGIRHPFFCILPLGAGRRHSWRRRSNCGSRESFGVYSRGPGENPAPNLRGASCSYMSAHELNKMPGLLRPADCIRFRTDTDSAQLSRECERPFYVLNRPVVWLFSVSLAFGPFPSPIVMIEFSVVRGGEGGEGGRGTTTAAAAVAAVALGTFSY